MEKNADWLQLIIAVTIKKKEKKHFSLIPLVIYANVLYLDIIVTIKSSSVPIAT